ncbi:hypothetical protein CRM22_008772 [Opisthorchis felineus]|uniref:Ran guanine nucleotide release factor n=1 Tax=Opisthorchis felineus TaxID=147828 RepID=A0A4S2LAD0_OPIFE|nr:hypothetical protein CRM22_008772 [Opisthorchis felineus]
MRLDVLPVEMIHRRQPQWLLDVATFGESSWKTCGEESAADYAFGSLPWPICLQTFSHQLKCIQTICLTITLSHSEMQDRCLFDGAFTLVLPSYAIDASPVPRNPHLFQRRFHSLSNSSKISTSDFAMHTRSEAVWSFLVLGVIRKSDLRQIPDNQEVFVHPSTNQSVVVDILEQIDTEDPKEAARLHFQEVGHTNDASEVVTETVEELSPPYRDPHCTSMVYLTGLQKVAKFNETVEHLVRIYQALYRYSHDSADVLVSVNNPLEDDYPRCALNGTASGDSVPSAPWDEQLIRTIACSLQLRSRAIFSL